MKRLLKAPAEPALEGIKIALGLVAAVALSGLALINWVG